jgi:hypothetical protein
MFESDPDFSGKTDSRFYFENLIAIEKPIRINQDSVFLFRAGSRFSVSAPDTGINSPGGKNGNGRSISGK